jgi:diguanylate cyclase (GGDEF)-like protein
VASASLAGEPSDLAGDVLAYGEAFTDGAPWALGLTGTVQAAGADLRAESMRQADQARAELRTQLAISAIVSTVGVAAALVLARSVTRPIERLERAAQQVHEGRFAVDPIQPSGPRELAEAAATFNDMALTLASVEAQAVALADDPEADVVDGPLPGRTGRALQVAINRLRASMRTAEEHRRELERAATHDGLTGLLNRAAALEIVERDLARVQRDGGSLMALFIDLDGLKGINDAHGHAAGDDALELTADALRAATRDADVVARLGGDEFLVAGAAGDGAAVGALAERIRQTVAAQVLPGDDGPVPLRCSIGIALSHPEHPTAESLIHDADVALYAAKRAGRDQVAWFDPQAADR